MSGEAFCADDALAELRDYFKEMVALKDRQLNQVSSHPGEANMIEGERVGYEHAVEMVESYQTRLSLMAATT